MTSELRSGGLVQLYARPNGFLAWSIPAWAVLCGAIASRGLALNLTSGVRLLLILLLVEAGWGALWRALSTTDWATPLRRWRNWRLGEDRIILPYSQPGSPGRRLFRWLSQLRSWGETVFLPSTGHALGMAVAGLVFALALAAVLGREMVVLTGGMLALMQLALVFDRGRGQAGAGWDGALRLGLPWLAGHLAFAALTLPSVAIAAAFSLAIAGIGSADQPQGRTLWASGQVAAAGLLLPLYRPLAIPFLFFLLVPQMLLPARSSNPSHWTRRAWPWMAAAMILTALVL